MENSKQKLSIIHYPLSIIRLNTNPRAENFRRNADKLSIAIDERKPDIARVCQKYSNPCRKPRKNIRESLYPHTTSDLIFVAAICKGDNESG